MAGSYLESYFLIQKETGGWGTAISAAMTSLPFLTWDVQPAYDTHESGMITGAAGAAAPILGVKRVAGRMSVEAGFSGLDHIIYGVLGAGSNPGITTPFKNRYTPSATTPSFTAHVGYGAVPDATHNMTYTGIKFNAVDLSFDAASGFMNVSCDVICRDEVSTATTGDVKGTIANTVVHSPIQIADSASVVTLDIGVGASAAYCVRSGNIKIERFLTANRICLGSSTIKEPVPQQAMKVSGTFNVEFIDRTIYDAFIAQTVQTTTQLKWDNGTTGTHALDIVMPKVVYTSGLPPIQSGDVLVAPVNWIAYGSAGTGATAEPINVTVDGLVDFDTL